MTSHLAIATPGCGCEGQEMQKNLISIDKALARVTAHAIPVSRTEAVSLDSAFSRMPSQQIRCRSMVPARRQRGD